MDNRAIDWNRAWKEMRAKRNLPARNADSWDKHAIHHAKKDRDSGYVEAVLRIVNPKPHWSVFDMACGAGALAVPLANRVKRVTAVDFSPKMLNLLNARCKAEGISNIRVIEGSWEDDWDALGIGKHDVAIASRSLVVDDLEAAILKLNRIARERVYITTIVGDGPHDRRIFEALGRELNPGPHYIYNYNLLCQMGIYANLRIIREERQRTYGDMEEALDTIRWMMGGVNEEEEKVLTAYLNKHLVHRQGRWSLDYRHMVRWAVMWWDKRDCYIR